MKAFVTGIKTNGEDFSYTLENVVTVNYVNNSIVITRIGDIGESLTYVYDEAKTGYKYNICFM